MRRDRIDEDQLRRALGRLRRDLDRRQAGRDGRSSTPSRMPLSGPKLASLALGLGGLLLGGIMMNRRLDQGARVLLHPDDAPARTRRVRPDPAPKGHTVTINRPRAEVYAFWRDPANLPRFLERVLSVDAGAPERPVWTLGLPGQSPVDLALEIIEAREDELIAWRSAEGAALAAEGRVRFRDAPAGRGTVVEALIDYHPPRGGIGQGLAWMLDRDPSARLRRELRRAKMLLETGEIATARNRPAAPPPPQA